MARQYLTREQKATVTQMAAEGHTVQEIADAIGKWPATVRCYINGNIFEVRELQGKMPDGTPKAGRAAGCQCPADSETEDTDTRTVVTDDTFSCEEERVKEPEDMEAPEAEVTEEDACGLEPWAVWMAHRMDALAAEIGRRLENGLWIDVPLIMEWNRHVDEIAQQKIMRGIEK